jgi:hypothetical protein
MRWADKITYANVVATLVLVLVVGGSGAYAGSQLAKHSVGTKQLKNEAVTSAKIKDGAVTGRQVDESSLGKVPNATHADGAGLADSVAAPEAPHLVGASGQPAFVSPWANNGGDFGPTSFYKDREGVVHLAGLASGNNAGDLVFVLPSGYRPANSLLFVTFGYSGAATDVLIKANGEVHAGNQYEVSLEGVTFRVG